MAEATFQSGDRVRVKGYLHKLGTVVSWRTLGSLEIVKVRMDDGGVIELQAHLFEPAFNVKA